jgi:hypothetical protein
LNFGSGFDDARTKSALAKRLFRQLEGKCVGAHAADPFGPLTITRDFMLCALLKRVILRRSGASKRISIGRAASFQAAEVRQISVSRIASKARGFVDALGKMQSRLAAAGVASAGNLAE